MYSSIVLQQLYIVENKTSPNLTAFKRTFVIVPEKRDLNEANMKIEVHPFSSSSQ